MLSFFRSEIWKSQVQESDTLQTILQKMFCHFKIYEEFISGLKIGSEFIQL